MRYFDTVHPAVTAGYFLSVMLLSVFSENPVLPFLSLFGGLAFAAVLRCGSRGYRDIAADGLLFLLVAVTNPLFVHRGMTPLFFLNGNAVTKEALFCGVSLAGTVLSAIFWFRCLNRILTSDKLLFLFGRVSPKVALLLSCTLRFVPRLKMQAQKIRIAQRTLGLYAADSWMHRLRSLLRTYSALVTWSLENAVDTGTSMRGRGYGLKGRTGFSLFRFRRQDLLLAGLILGVDALVITATACGRLAFAFYPRMTAGTTDGFTIAAIAAFAVLSFLPFILEEKEIMRWHYYRSKI